MFVVNEMTEEYLPLQHFDDYEILITSPYTVRRIDTKEIVQTDISKDGYITLLIGYNTLYLHRLVRQMNLSSSSTFASMNSMNNNNRASTFTLRDDENTMKKVVIDKREVINYFYTRNGEDVKIYHKLGGKYREVQRQGDSILIGAIQYDYSYVVNQLLNPFINN